ncbi:MAG TPA: hypothetical protein PKU94_06440 [Candidatus Hydrothermia bacterium]|nr:hypothetical protein [Candidatus Hydrothermia bacterium]
MATETIQTAKRGENTYRDGVLFIHYGEVPKMAENPYQVIAILKQEVNLPNWEDSPLIREVCAFLNEMELNQFMENAGASDSAVEVIEELLSFAEDNRGDMEIIVDDEVGRELMSAVRDLADHENGDKKLVVLVRRNGAVYESMAVPVSELPLLGGR